MGVIVGLIAILFAIASMVAALMLRSSNRANLANLLRYIFLAGIPLLFFCSAAGLWDCYTSNDWTKGLVPIAMLLFAGNALLNRKQCIELIDKLTGTKQAPDNHESATTNQRPRSKNER